MQRILSLQSILNLFQKANGNLREDQIRFLLKEYMYKHRFVVSYLTIFKHHEKIIYTHMYSGYIPYIQFFTSLYFNP